MIDHSVRLQARTGKSNLNSCSVTTTSPEPRGQLVLLFDLGFLEEDSSPHDRVELDEPNLVLGAVDVLSGCVEETSASCTEQLDGNGRSLPTGHLANGGSVHLEYSSLQGTFPLIWRK